MTATATKVTNQQKGTKSLEEHLSSRQEILALCYLGLFILANKLDQKMVCVHILAPFYQSITVIIPLFVQILLLYFVEEKGRKKTPLDKIGKPTFGLIYNYVSNSK